MILEKVNYIGIGYYDQFSDGSEIEITQKEYEETRRPKGWIGACARLKFDTPNGKLADGQFAIVDDVLMAGKIKGFRVSVFERGKIDLTGTVNDELILQQCKEIIR